MGFLHHYLPVLGLASKQAEEARRVYLPSRIQGRIDSLSRITKDHSMRTDSRLPKQYTVSKVKLLMACQSKGNHEESATQVIHRVAAK
jgi:hypothetical protein